VRTRDANAGERGGEADQQIDHSTFHNQCFAIAIDSKDGTPGIGWSIVENQSMADKQAINLCRSSAGADRRNFCVVMKDRGINRGGDGNAK
jgi:hypothetical protein